MMKHFTAVGVALLVAAAPVATTTYATSSLASEVKYIVNDVPITSYDVQRRVAFLKLQKRNSNADEELIEQALLLAEMERLDIRISDKQVDDAYVRFADSNGLKPKQMNQILAQSGVTVGHFKEYIRVKIGWNQTLSTIFRAKHDDSTGGISSDQDIVRRMLQKGGPKPSTTEYMLQQVIFVIPAAERNLIGKRKREADYMRARVSSCDQTRELAKGLLDVTVRDLGRVLAPQLPSKWVKDIKRLKAGGVTPVRETNLGVEFIGVCSARKVSYDKVASMVFQAEDVGKVDKAQTEEFSKKYLTELRAKARIVTR